MTKVEEERRLCMTSRFQSQLAGHLDALISAAEAKGEAKGHAEGVAEERARAKMEFEKLYGPIVEVHNVYGSDGNTSWICSAPPKECE